jgi:hypothetical protein
MVQTVRGSRNQWKKASDQGDKTAWFGNTPFEHPFSHNTPFGYIVDPDKLPLCTNLQGLVAKDFCCFRPLNHPTHGDDSDEKIVF